MKQTEKTSPKSVRLVYPMLAVPASKLPIGDEWTYEVKLDGYRTLALKEGQRVILLSRKLKDATTQYLSVAKLMAQLPVEDALLDGEIVALDDNGLPSFQALQHQSARTIVYYTFDIIHLNGRDLTKTSLDQRRTVLTELLKGTRVLRSEPLSGTADDIEKTVRRLQLEGVVAKRRFSLYEPGKRSHSWVVLFQYLSSDHAMLVALLERATPKSGIIDENYYAEFRKRLLRYI